MQQTVDEVESGPLSGISIVDGTAAYSRLRSQVAAAGILERSLSFYALLAVFVFAGFAISTWAIFIFDNYLLLTAACLGFTFFSVQMAGIMHDCGHRAVFSSPRMNDILGYAAAAALGMVLDNWRNRHNAHHAFSNRVGKDPDMDVPFVAINEALLSRKSSLERYFARHQALYFHALGAIVSFSNRLGTFSYFNTREKRATWRFAFYLAGVVFLFVLPFVLFSPTKAIFVFSLVHISSGFYLAACFAPNHKGMAIVAPREAMSFIEQQVTTSRNIGGGFITDLLLVGLNRQTEHHLFPNCPRNKLRLIQPYLKDTCNQLGITYTEVSFIESNAMILRKLRQVARFIRQPLVRTASVDTAA